MGNNLDLQRCISISSGRVDSLDMTGNMLVADTRHSSFDLW